MTGSSFCPKQHTVLLLCHGNCLTCLVIKRYNIGQCLEASAPARRTTAADECPALQRRSEGGGGMRRWHFLGAAAAGSIMIVLPLAGAGAATAPSPGPNTQVPVPSGLDVAALPGASVFGDTPPDTKETYEMHSADNRPQPTPAPGSGQNAALGKLATELHARGYQAHLIAPAGRPP